MAAEAGIGAVPWAKYLRAEPLPGSLSKSVLYQLAKGDQQAVNPGMSALIREGNLADRSVFYRHDLAFAIDPTIPQEPPLVRGAADQPQRDGPNDLARCAGAIGGVFRLAWRDHDPSDADRSSSRCRCSVHCPRC